MAAFSASTLRDERTRSSIYTTAETLLAAFADPGVLASALDPEIRAERLLDGASHTLYLCAPAHEQRRLQPLFATLIQEIETYVTNEARQNIAIVVGALVDDDLPRLAELRDLRVLELQTHLLGDHLGAREDRDVLEHPLATIAEARRLDRNGGEGAAELVDDDRRERLALDVLGKDQQRRPARMTCSSTGRMSLTAPIFWFATRMYGSSRTASMRSGSVIMYGER